MDRATVATLQRMHDGPAVSILMPTRRRYPGNAEDPVLLRDLVHEARARLVDAYGDGAVSVVENLEAAARRADLQHPGDGLAIFAAADRSELFNLEFPVPQRVVVADTFATRDLVRGLARRPAYRVLVLSEKRTRLFDATGAELEEVRAGQFPLAIEGAHGEQLPSGAYAPHTSRPEHQLRDFFRRVDRALDRACPTSRGLIVIGEERELALFDEVTRHSDVIVGRVVGNHASTDEAGLVELARPVVESHMQAQQIAASERLVKADGAKRLARGLDEVLECARQGRGELLAVVDDPESGAEAEAVDAAVDAVLAHDGDVIFMDPALVGEYGPLALVLRW